MARQPNYNFERQERERLKALKVAEKAAAKQRERAQNEAASKPADSSDDQ